MIDRLRAANYIAGMAKQDDYTISEQELRALETRVEELIRACGHLKDENKKLRERQDALVQERSELLEKTNLARTRVDAMITRLKSLEVST